MKVQLEIPDYDSDSGVKYFWETGFEIEFKMKIILLF